MKIYAKPLVEPWRVRKRRQLEMQRRQKKEEEIQKKNTAAKSALSETENHSLNGKNRKKRKILTYLFPDESAKLPDGTKILKFYWLLKFAR